jgi:hypothetical protein
MCVSHAISAVRTLIGHAGSPLRTQPLKSRNEVAHLDLLAGFAADSPTHPNSEQAAGQILKIIE